MRRRMIAVALGLCLLTGCSRGGSPPHGDPPATTVPPAAVAPAPGAGPSAEAPPVTVGPPAAPAARPVSFQVQPSCDPIGAKPDPASDGMSTVGAHLYVQDDPGISSTAPGEYVHATVASLPITIVAEFSAPVDPTTFHVQVAPTLPYERAGNAQGEVHWLSDQAFQITVQSIPEPVGQYGISFGGGRDAAGREVCHRPFTFQIQPVKAQIYAWRWESKAEPTLVFDRATSLTPASVSPDGQWALLLRRSNDMSSGHGPLRVPYVANLQTGDLRSYQRTSVFDLRWDPDGQGVWVNGWQRLQLGGPGDSRDDLAARLSLDRSLSTEVSPDGRYLAQLRYLTPENGEAELRLLDVKSGEIRTLGGFGYPDSNGPSNFGLQWTADSKALLVSSWERDAGKPDSGTSHPTWVDPVTLQKTPLNLPGNAGYVRLSPRSTYLVVPGQGLFRRDGTPYLRTDAGIPFADAWSADERWIVALGLDGQYGMLDVARREFHPLNRPTTLDERGSPLGLSADGSTIYWGVRR